MSTDSRGGNAIAKNAVAPKIGVVLLAGGVGRRFGTDKRRALLPHGASLLATTLARYATCFDYLRVGLRADDQGLAAALASLLGGVPVLTAASAHTAPRAIVLCTAAERGMGATLAAALATTSGWDAAAIALGDMPFVTQTSLLALRRVAETQLCDGEPVVLQPTAAGVPGHPVLFSRALFPELLALDGDRGAREVVERNAGRRIRRELWEPGLLRDVDTAEALPTN